MRKNPFSDSWLISSVWDVDPETEDQFVFRYMAYLTFYLLSYGCRA